MINTAVYMIQVPFKYVKHEILLITVELLTKDEMINGTQQKERKDH